MEKSRSDMVLTRDGHVATITLNRPQQLNVWNPDMEGMLEEMMLECGRDPEVRVIVLTGAGRAFCAGVDLQYLKAAREAGSSRHAERPRAPGVVGARFSFMQNIPQPIICAINGPAAGVGVVLSLFSDIRYMAASAKLALVFSRRGLLAEHGLAWVLPRMIGLPRASEWLISGRTMLADEADRVGLVNAVLPDEGFQAEVARRAGELAVSASPLSTRVIKRQLVAAMKGTLSDAIALSLAELPACVASEDFREGVQHMLEKRPPRFLGR